MDAYLIKHKALRAEKTAQLIESRQSLDLLLFVPRMQSTKQKSTTRSSLCKVDVCGIFKTL